MPVARTYSIALVGVEGHPVEIEADIENGLPGLLLVGLPDTALREARDRIRAAIINSSEQWPQRRITVGLSQASLPKRGSGFDIGIAVAILAAAGVVPAAAIDGPEATINDDPGLSLDLVDDLPERLQRSYRLVELTATMIGDHHPIRTAISGDACVLPRQNCL